MLRIFISIFTLSLLLSLVLILGCGDENKTIEPVIPVEGELTDQRFLFAGEALESDIISMTEVSMLTPIFILMSRTNQSSSIIRDRNFMYTSINPDFIGIAFNSLNNPTMSSEGWYVYEYDISILNDISDTTFAIGTDSVRMLLNDSIVEWIDIFSSPFNKMQSRNRAAWHNNLSSDSGISRHNIDHTYINGFGLPDYSLDITVIDTIHTSIQDDSGFCLVDLYTTATGNDILITGTQSGLPFCADGGTLTVNTLVTLDCTEQSQTGKLGVAGLWTLEGAYDSMYVQTYKLTHGNIFWNYSDTCTPQFFR